MYIRNIYLDVLITNTRTSVSMDGLQTRLKLKFSEYEPTSLSQLILRNPLYYEFYVRHPSRVFNR